MTATAALEQFQWKPQPLAQQLINDLVAEFLARCPFTATLAQRMKAETGTRFVDWIDHIQCPRNSDLEFRLLSVGFVHRPQPGAEHAFHHPGGIFPEVVLADDPQTYIAIKVDDVVDFLTAHQIPYSHHIEGEPLAQIRMAPACRCGTCELWAIERHGLRGYDIPRGDPHQAMLTLRHLEAFRRRDRDFADDAEGFAHVNSLVDAAVADLGRDLACDLFFKAEREYWQRRNRAAQVQKARQDRLGLGWANHDHHTYRASRHNFHRLIALHEKLGLTCRERFYAGHEAGWGAQVMEQAVTGITTFNDVDMSPDELLGDFAHEPMAPRDKLGTVGLWCGLHGDSMLQAGMHHLECQFDHHALVKQLEESAAIKTMAPFTTFPFLRQAFTEGERWSVAEPRIARLLSAGFISEPQAAQFRATGAIGSHLENLERNDGYKGFNQTGVSDIIARTDPRKHAGVGA